MISLISSFNPALTTLINILSENKIYKEFSQKDKKRKREGKRMFINILTHTLPKRILINAREY